MVFLLKKCTHSLILWKFISYNQRNENKLPGYKKTQMFGVSFLTQYPTILLIWCFSQEIKKKQSSLKFGNEIPFSQCLLLSAGSDVGMLGSRNGLLKWDKQVMGNSCLACAVSKLQIGDEVPQTKDRQLWFGWRPHKQRLTHLAKFTRRNRVCSAGHNAPGSIPCTDAVSVIRPVRTQRDEPTSQAAASLSLMPKNRDWC